MTTEKTETELTVLVEPDEDDGGFVSSIPNLPGVRSQGETEQEAVENVLDALRYSSQDEYAVSPLSVNVDFVQLVDRYGDEGVWEVLGKIKDFLS